MQKVLDDKTMLLEKTLTMSDYLSFTSIKNNIIINTDDTITADALEYALLEFVQNKNIGRVDEAVLPLPKKEQNHITINQKIIEEIDVSKDDINKLHSSFLNQMVFLTPNQS